mgnify:CR=1 FL=1
MIRQALLSVLFSFVAFSTIADSLNQKQNSSIKNSELYSEAQVLINGIKEFHQLSPEP